MIMLLDNQLRRIVDVLRDTGQLDNTLIVYMSDHGELLGDHGLILKGCRFFDGLVRIPMIFSWPGELRAGLRSDALVESVDVAPTLLQAAGLEVPRSMQGRSLLPLMRGQADPHHHKPAVISEFKDSIGGPQHADHSHGSMVFDGRYKSVVYHGHRIGELYDTQADPGEFDNLWDDPAARELKLDRLKFHLDAMMATVSAGPERSVAY
jgi:arylsulfatase A-like enzyme